MEAGERGGRVSLIGGEGAGGTLALADLSLTDERAGPVRMRSLEALPATARIRFIDEGADYQTGATLVRGEGDGGGVDADLPAVCGAGLAKALARRLLKGEGEDRLTVALGPLEALRLEAGDTVAVEGEIGTWRVERVTLDETPTAVLARRAGESVGTEPVVWRPGAGIEAVGAPFVCILDLPPLPGAEADDRLIAAVAREPWRPMTVHVGEDAETLTARGTVGTPATVGRLTQALAPGALHRWDETNAVVARLEGAAPASLPEGAVLAGANLIAVESAAGWEIVQYRQAILLGEGIWRLSGLLRGQQGTEGAMAAGAPEGGLIILLAPRAGRFETATGERSLVRIARVGPSGRAPGGAGFAETTFTPMGLHARPWSPVLSVVVEGGGRRLFWTPRVRIDDVWDLEPVEVDPRRFRVCILDGGEQRRVFEVEDTSILYTAEDLAEDFPGGGGPDAVVTVAQYGAGFGWGVEAQAPLIV